MSEIPVRRLHVFERYVVIPVVWLVLSSTTRVRGLGFCDDMKYVFLFLFGVCVSILRTLSMYMFMHMHMHMYMYRYKCILGQIRKIE